MNLILKDQRLIFLFMLLITAAVLETTAQTIPIGKVVIKDKIKQNIKLEKLSPGGNLYTPVERLNIISDIQRQYTKKGDENRNNYPWELVGPSGILSSQGINFVCSGRIRDIEILGDNHMRVASASGGLWEIQKGASGKINYSNLSSSSVTSPWSGTVATDPYDQKTILFGTGEPGIRSGGGLWKSIDNGKSWNNIPMNGGIGMSAFDEMEFTAKAGKVWTCGSDGVFFSGDSGSTWQLKRTGNYPGMVIYSNQPDTMLVSEYDKGIFRTRNGGKSWQKLSNGLPQENFNRIEMANCKSQPNVIYALYTKKDGTTLGIFKSINGGDEWAKCTVIDDNGVKDVDYHWGMAWYCSFISVSPTNPNHVISGGGWYIYSEDGQNFYGPTEGQHADFHSGGWSKDGKTAWYANDGGIYATTFDKKWKWDVTFNDLPITQFVTVSVSRTNPDVVIGGTQDNGLVYYNAKAKKWFYFSGDGGGVAIDPNDENKVYGTLGVSGPPLTFNNYRKFGPSAAGWESTNFGLRSSGQWWRLVRTDQNNPTTLYTQADNKLYYSNNEGGTWEYLGFQDLDIIEISSLRVSHGEYPKVYVSGSGPDSTSIMVLDFAIWEWTNIAKGLPTKYNQPDGLSIAHAYTSDNPEYANRVYALMRGYGKHLDNNILFRSDNSGTDWTNISGNLPNVPFSVMMEHPLDDRILIAGTDGFGIFITEDGGKNWSLWDNGMPKGAFITDLDYQKFNDSIYVVASTYGHSILRRFVPSSGSVNTKDIIKTTFVNQIKKAYFDGQSIQLSLTKNVPNNTLLKVCSINGQCIYQTEMTASKTEYDISIGPIPSGIYICSLQSKQKLIGTTKILIP